MYGQSSSNQNHAILYREIVGSLHRNHQYNTRSYWVPRHCRREINEKVDKMAQEGSEMSEKEGNLCV